MSPRPAITRRAALLGAAGLSLAFAGRAVGADFGGRKLVVIIARGGMDGLSVAPPLDDPDYARLRGELAIQAPLPVNADFGLHPALKELHRMAQAGQARIAPAVAIPERQRSHFEAQDLLESGAPALYGAGSGWLNRALQASGSTRGLAVGAQTPLVLRGPVQAASWSPGPVRGHDDRLATALQDLYAGDPLLGPAFASGLSVEAMAETATDGLAFRRNDVKGLGDAIARFMVAADGPDVVALSLDGFDTHARQGADQGQLATRLAALDAVLAGLEQGLGPVWSKTVVIAATEFGRTARANGTGGTDHGTASTALVAGGALKPGGIVGDWPGLAEARLFENRDLAPTLDVRALFKGVLRDHLRLDAAVLDRDVFPDSAGVRGVEGLIA